MSPDSSQDQTLLGIMGTISVQVIISLIPIISQPNKQTRIPIQTTDSLSILSIFFARLPNFGTIKMKHFERSDSDLMLVDLGGESDNHKSETFRA